MPDIDLDATEATGRVLYEVARERARQTAKHGDQSHLPDGTAAGLVVHDLPVNAGGHAYAGSLARWAKRRTKAASQNEGGDGTITYEHILTEECGGCDSCISAQITYHAEARADRGGHTVRIFQLHRDQDITGVSGTGVVADGVEFDDGTVVIRWRGERPSTVVWEDLDAARAVHEHGGATRFVLLDAAGRPLGEAPEPPAVTGRGFGVYLDTVDTYGKLLDVAESSVASYDAVWIHSARPAHLDEELARQVRDALNNWLLGIGSAFAWTQPEPTGEAEHG